jgi:hypothetical protein
MAKLPQRFVDRATIENMAVGDRRYTTPWGMWVDMSMDCWLHPNYPAYEKPGGTVRMPIERREDGYHVWPPSDESYRPSHKSGFVSSGPVEFIPVAQIHD